MKHRMKKFFQYLLCTVFLCFLHIAGFPDDSFLLHEQRVEESFRRGDYFDMFARIEDLLLAHPARPEAFLYVYDITRLGEVIGRDRAFSTLKKLDALYTGDKSGEQRGAKKLLLMLEMEKLLQPVDRARSEKISRALSPVRNWVLMGPYWKYGPGDLYASFLPEQTDSLSAKSLPSRRVRIEGDGTLHLARFLYPAAGVAYAAFSFRSEKDIKLRLYSDERYALFVNGKKILVNDENGAKRRLRIVRLWGSNEFTVMVKIHKKSSWSLRVLVTDTNDTPIELPVELDRFYRADFRYAEEMEYPFAELMEKSDEGMRAGALASFFDELDSDESLQFYKKAAETKGTLVAKYLYAAALIGYGGDRADSARNLEGRRLMKEVHDADAAMIPALHKRFRAIYDSKDNLAAVNFGKEIYGISKNFFPFRRDYLRLLRFLDYRKEFEDEISKMKLDFPSAAVVLKEEAAYYRKRNPQKSAKLYEAVLEKEYDKKSLSGIVRYLKKRNEEKKALEILDKHDGENDFWYERASLLIALDRFDEAKKLLFTKLLDREEPDCYRLLGYMDAKSGDDPLMHWKRELEIYPSNFSLDEYVRYLEKGEISTPLFCKESKEVHDMIAAWKGGAYDGLPSCVLYRGRSYELLPDGGSRVYCEELLFLKDKKAIERWGEFEVVHSGEFKPVSVRVYHKDGGYTDAYSVQDVDGDRYINLPSLKEYSLAHVSYIIDNPVREPAYANLFALPSMEICDFDEPVKKFYFSVSVPKNMKCSITAPPSARVSEIARGETITHSFSLIDIPAIARERFSGNRLNVLPHYAFSTMDGDNDFAAWYRGLLVGMFDMDAKLCRQQFNGRGKALIENIYEYVARNIELEKRKLFYPQKASDVYYAKRSGVEGKAILTKSILERFGILSFIAFTKRNDRPFESDFTSPHGFTDILLYVPVSSEEALWLDFSSMEYACGDVSPLLEGAEALLLVGGGVERKRIEGKQQGKVKSYFRIEIGQTGETAFQGKVELFGPRGDFRRKLIDPREEEKSVRNYFGFLFSTFDMDDYATHNVRDYAKPLVLTAKGSCHDIALASGSGIVVKASPYPSEATEYVLYASRQHPLFIGEPVYEDDIYEYVLPVGARVAALPERVSHETRFGKIELDARYDAKEHKVFVRKKTFLKSGRIAPGEYGEFVNFCAKIKEAEGAGIVLTIKDSR